MSKNRAWLVPASTLLLALALSFLGISEATFGNPRMPADVTAADCFLKISILKVTAKDVVIAGVIQVRLDVEVDVHVSVGDTLGEGSGKVMLEWAKQPVKGPPNAPPPKQPDPGQIYPAGKDFGLIEGKHTYQVIIDTQTNFNALATAAEGNATFKGPFTFKITAKGKCKDEKGKLGDEVKGTPDPKTYQPDMADLRTPD